MKFLFDILPVIIFFVVYKFFGIYAATASAIVFSILQIAALFFLKKKIDFMSWVSLGIIVLFGGATLILHNELFIKWKPTVLYAFFGVALFVSEVFFKKNLLKTMLSENIQVGERIWKKLNRLWVTFFLTLALLNLYVAYNFPTDTWVNFKLFGFIGLTVLFVVGQSLWLVRHLPKEEGV